MTLQYIIFFSLLILMFFCIYLLNRKDEKEIKIGNFEGELLRSRSFYKLEKQFNELQLEEIERAKIVIIDNLRSHFGINKYFKIMRFDKDDFVDILTSLNDECDSISLIVYSEQLFTQSRVHYHRREYGESFGYHALSTLFLVSSEAAHKQKKYGRLSQIAPEIIGLRRIQCLLDRVFGGV